MVSYKDDSFASVLPQNALEHLAKHHKVRDPTLVDRAVARDPGTGEAFFRFVGVARDDANGPQTSLILDADGNPVDDPKASALFERPDLEDLTVPPVTLAKAKISPESNDFSLPEGEVFEETITVTVPGNAVTPKADVYFLADTTASMGGILNAVSMGANSILNALNGSGVDLAFGVGNYRDFPKDAYAFQHQLSPTSNAAQVAAAISAWSPVGGGDGPEGQLFALDALAVPPGGAIGWRPGSKRIIVWFGDAPGHEPICTAISGAPADITAATVTAKLVAESITVIAISTATPGLDGDPTIGANDYAASCGPPGGSPGQASSIAAATGGTFVTGIVPGNIVATISSLLTAAVGGINSLTLVPSGAIASCVDSIDPAGGYGPLPGDKTHTLTFRVRFVGNKPCKEKDQVFTGSLDVVADGKVIARKPVRIMVPACKLVYTVKYVCGTQDDCCGHCAPVAPGRYATEINIHNPGDRKVEIIKRVIPLVLAGAPAGREPHTVGPRAVDRVVLPPHNATMDDCCRLTELLFGAGGGTGLNIGLLEITSTGILSVTAVYTATGQTGGISIDVETIVPQR